MKFKKYLNEGYSKKSAVVNSKEISQELYDMVQNSKRVEQTLGGVSKNKMKPDMFHIEIFKGQFGLDVYAKPLSKNPGLKPGRTSFKTYDYISIRYSDWFNGDTIRRNFKTSNDFNKYLDNLRNMNNEI